MKYNKVLPLLFLSFVLVSGCGKSSYLTQSTDRVVTSEKEAKQEEKSLGLQDKVDAAKSVHKVVSTLDDIEKVGARAALGKGMKTALVKAVVSGLYDEEEEPIVNEKKDHII